MPSPTVRLPQTAAARGVLRTVPRFHHASFTVSDREESVAWYEEVLGFERHSEDNIQLEVFSTPKL